MIYTRIRFFLLHIENYFIQFFLLSFINSVKLLGIQRYFDTNFVLNRFIDQCKSNIDYLIKNENLQRTENNILYKEFIPTLDLYPSKTILFFGGRNSYFYNHDFCKRLSEILCIKTISMQYDGFYDSGNNKSLSFESYIKSIEIIYNKFFYKTDLYVIGYSIGSYGAVYINKKDKIFLISPIYSLQRVLRNAILIPEFCLNSLLKHKENIKIHAHTFKHDLVTPKYHLTDNFLKPNVKISEHNGNHITGITNYLIPYIKEYIED